MSIHEPYQSLEEEVSNTFVQRLHGEWTPADQAALERRLASDSAYAEAYRLAAQSMALLGTHAEMPEMMQFRERALAHARRSSVSRWLGSDSGRSKRWYLAAGVCGAAVVLAAAWQLSAWGYKPGQYRTGIGEQRLVELDDHSRIALDATTRIAVRYTGENRTIQLIEGQVQFSVAKDPMRPFRVQVGDHTIIALGTVFTVEFTGRKIHVAMMEGRVAVVPRSPSSSSYIERLTDEKGGEARSHPHSPSSRSRSASDSILESIELSAGEELRVGQDGRTTLIEKADLEAATAWRNGKIVFRTERLGEAVRRMNRYSRVQLEVGDPALADETVSGVFEAGDTQGFIAGVRLALPVVVNNRDTNTVTLTLSK